MKKFCLLVLAFTCLLYGYAVVLDCCMTKYLQKSTERKYIGWNYIFDDTTYHDLVINGSSRAWIQYDPYILDSILCINSYNLGIDGSTINRQIIKYQTYCKYHPIPKYLIQNIDYFTLCITKGYEREQFFPYFYNREFLHAIDAYEHFSFSEKYFPYYRYLGYFPPIHEPFQLYKGYQGMDWQWEGTALNNIQTIEAPLDKDMYNLCRQFVYTCKKNGTKILFVIAPAYYKGTEKYQNLESIYKAYQSLSEEFDIPILDYTKDSICFDTTYFYNGMHLNKRGAELFSTKLAHDIDSIGFLR